MLLRYLILSIPCRCGQWGSLNRPGPSLCRHCYIYGYQLVAGAAEARSIFRAVWKAALRSHNQVDRLRHFATRHGMYMYHSCLHPARSNSHHYSTSGLQGHMNGSGLSHPADWSQLSSIPRSSAMTMVVCSVRGLALGIA